MTDALAVLSGLLIGVLSGLIGIGGGVLLVPLLVLGFGFSQSPPELSNELRISQCAIGRRVHLRTFSAVSLASIIR